MIFKWFKKIRFQWFTLTVLLHIWGNINQFEIISPSYAIDQSWPYHTFVFLYSLSGLHGLPHTLFVGRDEVDDVESLEKVELYLVEKCVGRRGFIVPTGGTLARIPGTSITIIPMPTFSATVTSAPFQFRKMEKTAIAVGKSIPEIEKGQALESLLHISYLSLP